jgi:hypothetical protein
MSFADPQPPEHQHSEAHASEEYSSESQPGRLAAATSRNAGDHGAISSVYDLISE